MANAFEQWLISKPKLAGIYGWGIRLPDRTTFSESYSELFPVNALNNAWRCVADTLQVIRLHRFPERRVRWVFEHGWLLCSIRPDGIFLGVFTANQIEQVNWAGVELMLEEFNRLDAKSSVS
jgi:hypothetical protein